MMAQWLVHLLHKQKEGVQFPVVAGAFFPTSIFFRTSVEKVIEQTIDIRTVKGLETHHVRRIESNVRRLFPFILCAFRP